jgi:Xaa-Pro aminopeptidase
VNVGPLAPLSSTDETIACLERLARFRRFMADDGLRGAVVTWPEHVRYLAGWSGGPGPAVLVGAGPDAFLVAPIGSVDATRCARLGVQIVGYAPYSPDRFVDPVVAAREATVGLLDRVRLRGRTGVEPDSLSVAVAAMIPEFEPIDIGATLARWRRVKDEFEQAAIRRSVAALERGFEEARAVIRPGIGEIDVLDAVAAGVSVAAGSAVTLESNLGSGPLSALEDPHATARVLASGDVVLIDLYPVIGGYVADLTRTFIVGRASSERRDRQAVLAGALAAGEAMLRPGVPARDIDRAVRDELRRQDSRAARSMTHHVGHGIGLRAWEEPWLGRSCDILIEAGMTVAIEPGRYVAGVEGMRLEGNYLVTAEGAERLDAFPSTLIECPG